ncbi:MAG: hypothetical protein KDJ35_09080, partial [Alphaproteobacteria bacterium]|nr:hypothetical protein [Alphaproteobacteria bacterium]
MSKIRTHHRGRKIWATGLFAFVMACCFLLSFSRPAQAIVTCPSCTWPLSWPYVPLTIDIEGTIIGPGEGACAFYDCPIARDLIVPLYHSIFEDLILDFVNSQFNHYRNWFVGTFFDQYVLRDFLLLSQQMSAIGMQQAMIVGTFFDGQTQLETQRLFNQLENEAHRDYLPTQDFCMFGTNVRSLAATEAQSRYYSLAMDARSMARHMGSANQVASSPDNDKRARWDVFTEKYCDPQDNNWRANSASVPTGLQGVCQGTGGDNERVNIDIDYTRLIDNPRTLDVTFNGSEDQEDVFALASNLYG